MKPVVNKITDSWLKKYNPCEESLDWWDDKERDPIKILEILIERERYRWANWFIVRIMEYKDYVSYAVYAAESVLPIYEKKYPNDKRPREAIEAAKKCVDNPSEENKKAAATAAAVATVAAAAAAAAAATDADADAAYVADATVAAATAAYAADATDATVAAADYAADAATVAAAYAAYAADAAAYAAYAADALRLKMLNYGMKLLKGG